MKIKIKDASSWQELTRQGFGTVLDPMVVRCGELFLKGGRGAGTAEGVWDLLKANIHGIAMFFDRLVMDEKIPIFNYGDTYDMGLDFNQRVFSRINDYDNVLYDVDVGFGPNSQYDFVKTAAFGELAKVYDGTHHVPAAMAKEVLDELSKAEYKWSPSIDRLPCQLKSDDERRLAAFLLGGLIFGGYAQQISGEHILQPKRSRLFLAVALGKDSAGHRLEDALFAELKSNSNIRCDDLPWTPTFFPYLLGKAQEPVDLIKLVADLRKSPEVKDYREWIAEVLRDIKSGKVSIKKRKDVRAVARSIERVLGTIPSLPKVELKITVADVATGKLPGGLDLTASLQALWGWFLSGIPGNRYRKLLARAVVADYEYPKLESRMKSVWSAGGGQWDVG